MFNAFQIIGLIVFLFCSNLSFGQGSDEERLLEFIEYYKTAKFYQSFDLDSANLYTDSCLGVAKEMESKFYLGKALQLKTKGEFYRSEIDSAIIYGNESIEILKNFPDSVEYFLAEYNQGNFYLSQDDHIQALIQFKKATKIVDENFETYVQANSDVVNLNRAYCHASIGVVLTKLDDYKGALKSYKKSLKISYKVDALESEVFRSVILNRMGDVHVKLGDYQIAESYAIASMEQKKKLGQTSSIGFSFQVLAESAFGRRKFDLALKYIDQSNKKFKDNDNWNEIDRNTFLEAKCYLAQDKYELAIKKLKSIENVYLTRFTKADQAEFYEVMSAAFNMSGDYKLANDYLRVTLRLRKDLDVKNDRKIVGEFVDFIEEEEIQLNSKIENLKNKQEKEKLELQIKAEKDKKVWIYTLFLVSIICLVLIILVISNAYRRNRKVTQELSNKMEENEILFKEVHHRVKNNFQIISSLLNLQQGIEEDERSREVLTDAQGRIQSMSLVHELLYRKNEVKQIDFKSYADELIHSILKSFHVEEKISSEIVCGRDLFDLEVAIPLGLILNEAITNSVKYAFKGRDKGKISVELTKGEDQNYMLKIADDGVGISDDFMSIMEETLGMELINILSEQLEGSVKFYNDNGTVMKVMFKG
jgi:two-component sensor histidine kinase